MAEEVWLRLGDPKLYVEPFAGMLGVLLNRPPSSRPRHVEFVVDADAMVCNFWRAFKYDPQALLEAIDYPAIQCDLMARRRKCYAWGLENIDRLSKDPKFYDAELAGWWAWGMNNAVGAIYTVQKPAAEGLGTKPKHNPTGINSALDYNRVKAQAWMESLAARLRNVRIYGGDWSKALDPERLDRGQPTSVFLDPPYKKVKSGSILGAVDTMYSSDWENQSDDIATQSYQWAVENGSKYRIAYCCGTGDFPCPDGWEEYTTRFRPGFSSDEKRDQYQDVMFFSPTCVKPDNLLL